MPTQSADLSKSPQRTVAAPLLIALVAVASFAAGVGNGFIADDPPILTDRLAGFDTWSSLPKLLAQSYWGPGSTSLFYRPLGLMWLAAERLLFGVNPLGYHLVGLAMYALCAVLVWRLLTHAWQGWPVLAAALLFAAHPIHAEAVLTAYGQLEMGSAIAVLLGLECFIQAEHKNWHILWLAASALASLVALGFKETGIVLPLLAVLIHASWLRRRAWAEVIFLVPLAIYFWARHATLGVFAGPRNTFASRGSLLFHAKAVFLSFAHALRWCLLPWGQNPAHSDERDRLLVLPFDELVWVAVTLAALWLLAAKIGRRKTVFVSGWFLLSWLPVSNIIPMEGIVNERSLFVPVLAVTLAVAWALAEFSEPRTRTLALTLLTALAMALSSRVCLRWRTNLTMWETTVQDHPRSPFAQVALANLLLRHALREGSVQERNAQIAAAQLHYKRALGLHSEWRPALIGLGLAAAVQGDCATARQYLDHAADPVLATERAPAELAAEARQICSGQ